MNDDLIGKIIHHWTVVSYQGLNKHNAKTYLCVCDCGNNSVVEGRALRSGRSKCCGCRKDTLIKHGHSKKGKITKEYSCWQGMNHRCYYKSNTYYHRYGGRGIKVCDRWRFSFENFLSDMGLAPSKNHSLDRIDNDGNYEPSNCRWAEYEQQCNNKSRCRIVTCLGKSLSIAQWARELGVSDRYFRGRVERGCDPKVLIRILSEKQTLTK